MARLLAQVDVAVIQDGTVAVEVAAGNALLQWPYLTDASLIMALISVFRSANEEAEDMIENAAAQSLLPPPPPDRAGLATAWLYVNIILTNSQIFVPVMDKVRWDDVLTRCACVTQSIFGSVLSSEA